MYAAYGVHVNKPPSSNELMTNQMVISYYLRCSGGVEAEGSDGNGVGIVINNRTKVGLVEWNRVNSRPSAVFIRRPCKSSRQKRIGDTSLWYPQIPVHSQT